MCYLRHLACLLGAGFLFTATTAAQPPTSAPPTGKPPTPQANKPPTVPAPKEDPKATKVLNEALANLKQQTSFETALSEHFDLEGVRMIVEGKVLMAPGYRIHAELSIHRGGLDAKRTLISDGTTLWEIEQAGSTTPKVSRIDLNKVRDALNRPDTPKEALEVFFLHRGVLGPVALLEKVHTLMTATHLETGVTLDDHKVNRVIVTWSKTMRDRIAPHAMEWMGMGAVGMAQLSLDEKTGWPYRIDWLAEYPPGQFHRTVRIEFSAPKHFASLSPEQQKAFTYTPAGHADDRTQEATNQANAIVRDLKAKKPAK